MVVEVLLVLRCLHVDVRVQSVEKLENVKLQVWVQATKKKSREKTKERKKEMFLILQSLQEEEGEEKERNGKKRLHVFALPQVVSYCCVCLCLSDVLIEQI